MVLRYEGNDFVCIFSHWNSTRAQNMKHVFKQNSFIWMIHEQHRNVWFSRNYSDLSWIRQGSRQKLNYDINS